MLIGVHLNLCLRRPEKAYKFMQVSCVLIFIVICMQVLLICTLHTSDCSPFIYSYQTIDALKEAEQARRQILDHLLER